MDQTAACRLRRASTADLDVILHHRQSMFEDMGFSDPTALAAAKQLSSVFFGDALAEGHYLGWLFEDPASGAVVAGGGIILVEFHPGPRDPHPRRPYVVNVYVEREWRRRGLARLLMEAMIEWTRDAGYKNLYLHASDEGRALYTSLGFDPTNEMLLTF